MMAPAADVAQVTVTEDEILGKFAAVMHEWGFRPFTDPLSSEVCGGVVLPGPDELSVRADEFEVRAAYAASR
jgi:hypothetical protein